MADAMEYFASILFAVFVVLFVCFSLRVWWVIGRRQRHVKKRDNPVKTLVVMGSGGHTSEMIRLLSGLSDMYCPRIYLIADTDKMSTDKVEEFESKRKRQGLCTDEESKTNVENKDYKLISIPRSREVKQSYLTSVFTTLHAFRASFPLVQEHKPDLILCNGPGTCIPVCIAALIMKIFGCQDVSLVYVESICRVKTLSLSGKILYHLANHFFVQWQALQDLYPKAVFLGRLV